MKILILTSTRKEIEPVLNYARRFSFDNYLISTDFKGVSMDILISGIGVYSTIYRLLKQLKQRDYDFVINCGIAGSFIEDLKIGNVVQVISEEIGDLGIESTTDFKTVFEMHYANSEEKPFKNGRMINPTKSNIDVFDKLKKVKGLTVNTAHGNCESISFLKQKFDADIETMEGAAAFYVCLQENVPFIETRSISNYVEERNVERWDIPLAIQNLGNVLIEFIKSLEKLKDG